MGIVISATLKWEPLLLMWRPKCDLGIQIPLAGDFFLFSLPFCYHRACDLLRRISSFMVQILWQEFLSPGGWCLLLMLDNFFFCFCMNRNGCLKKPKCPSWNCQSMTEWTIRLLMDRRQATYKYAIIWSTWEKWILLLQIITEENCQLHP